MPTSHLEGCQVPGKHTAHGRHYNYGYREAASQKGKKLAWVLIPALQLTHCVTSGKFLPLSGLRCSICKTRRWGYMTLWP